MNEGASDLPIQGADVCAVVVTYHPDAGLPNRLSSVSAQAGAVVVVDNGSADAERSMLRQAASDPKIELLLNPENFGLARAINIGIQRAAALGYSWVLLLDQDTLVDPHMLHTLSAIVASFPDRERLALVGSNFRDSDERAPGAADRQSPDEGSDDRWEDVDCVITSGSLLPLAAHFAIGPFREEFFIDYVDEEYCRRAKAKGYRVIRSRKQIMLHTIGAPTVHKTLWIKKWTSNHTPDRRYYIARNNTVLLHEYGNSRAGMWIFKSFGRSLRLCKRIALYERTKARKIAAVMHGWWDGVRGNMGPRNPQQGASTDAAAASASFVSGRHGS
ncbi:MAG TPA: glycosyltransferase family 2 protein [Steroidobacteraceae bacterium]|jgi:rhamnosyltransferase